VAANALDPIDYTGTATLTDSGGPPPPEPGTPPAPEPEPPPPPAVEPPALTIEGHRIRSRAIRVRLSTTGAVRDVRAALRRGRRIFAAGRRARLESRGRVDLKLQGRLRRGRYVLAVSARTPDGGTVGTSKRLRFRR